MDVSLAKLLIATHTCFRFVVASFRFYRRAEWAALGFFCYQCDNIEFKG